MDTHEILAMGSWLARNWALMAITLTCLSLMVFVLILVTKYVRICLNIFLDTSPPLMAVPRGDRPALGEIVRFRSFDGTSLRGQWIRGSRSAGYRGTIVFCHEFQSDMHSCLHYARPLREAGFDLFTFDFRGHGESSCPGRYRPLQWPSDKDMEDVLGACAYVESELESQGRPPEIGLLGISRGAGAGLLAAATDPCIKAIACDGAFSTKTTLVALMKRWAYIFARFRLVYQNHTETFWRFLLWLVLRFAQPKLGCKFPSVRRALAEMQPRAIFFIHGERDSYIRVEQARFLYDLAPSPKYLWIAPNAKHNKSVTVHPDPYARRTIAFFSKHLAGQAVEDARITNPVESDVA
jgi:pimeloyl-ACP methyl ester carboxylesterase